MVDEVKTEDAPDIVVEKKNESLTEESTSVDVKTDDATSLSQVKVEEATLLEGKIIRQVEYYFGNTNLWRDKFLKEKLKEDSGWVTLECLCTFNRLQQLSSDFEEIVVALEKSKTGLLEISEDRLKVRRSPSNPLPDPDDPIIRKASKMKTLYMKGFPKTYQLDDVQDYISSQGCQTVFVKMKLDEERKFKGSIIVELSTLEQADKFLKEEFKCGETTLTVMRRDEYFMKKNEDRNGNKFSGHKRGAEDCGDADGDAKKSKEEAPMKIGCVLHFKGCNTETMREDLKSVFGKNETIDWVDFERGETQGYIRFAEEGSAKKALDGVKAENEDKIIIKETECEARIIEGIEEKNYWILVNEEKKRAKSRFGGRGGKGGRGGRGGRFNKKGGKGNEEWRKRRRPWENGNDENKKKESLGENKNEHIKFDDDEKTTPEKKPKVEEEKPAALTEA